MERLSVSGSACPGMIVRRVPVAISARTSTRSPCAIDWAIPDGEVLATDVLPARIRRSAPPRGSRSSNIGQVEVRSAGNARICMFSAWLTGWRVVRQRGSAAQCSGWCGLGMGLYRRPLRPRQAATKSAPMGGGVRATWPRRPGGGGVPFQVCYAFLVMDRGWGLRQCGTMRGTCDRSWPVLPRVPQLTGQASMSRARLVTRWSFP